MRDLATIGLLRSRLIRLPGDVVPAGELVGAPGEGEEQIR